MKKTDLCALLEKIGVRPSRKMGQNFLIDANLLASMVKSATPVSGEHILEIGPGTGQMTQLLLDAGVQLQGVELDHRLAAYLRDKFKDNSAFQLLETDACKVDYDELMGRTPYRCIANLPYSCGSVFLAKIARVENRPQELFVLLQQEMGDRLVAEVGTKQYSALGVRLAWFYKISIVRKIPPDVFFPSPEIYSVFLRLVLQDEIPSKEQADCANHMVKLAFAQRRKMSFRLLCHEFDPEIIQSGFSEVGIPLDVRADHISSKQYLQLAAFYLQHKNK